MHFSISSVLLFVLISSCSEDMEMGQAFSPNPTAPAQADISAPPTAHASGPILPSQAGGLSSLTVGEHHSCAILEGRVFCWGYGLSGQLGQGDYQNHAEPMEVTDLGQDNVSVYAGDLHSCAIKRSGAVYCWGYNQTGAIGNGHSGRDLSFSGQAKLNVVTRPSLVQGLEGISITQVAATRSTTCALSTVGDIYCWGSGASYQLGDARKDDDATRYAHHRGVAGRVTVLEEQAREIYAGDRAFCAVTIHDRIQCWGVLTLPTEVAYPEVDLSAGKRPVSLSMADQHHCFVTTEGQLHCIGDNWYQQNGLPGITNDWTLVPGETFLKISTARKTTCGITPGQRVRCWGVCLYGLCGPKFSAKLVTPTQPQNVYAYTAQKSIEIEGISGAVSIAVGARHACALLEGGHIKCWGNGFLGELGHGETQASAEPVDVAF